jgi:GcrA cell cycle regulator
MRTRLVGATPFKEKGRGLAMEELDAGQRPDDLMLRDPGPGTCPRPELLAEAARPATRCTIMQLTSRTCRWPLWGKERLPVEKQYYCGEAVAAGVYCTAHCKLTYARRDERRR